MNPSHGPPGARLLKQSLGASWRTAEEQEDSVEDARSSLLRPAAPTARCAARPGPVPAPTEEIV